ALPRSGGRSPQRSTPGRRQRCGPPARCTSRAGSRPQQQQRSMHWCELQPRRSPPRARCHTPRQGYWYQSSAPDGSGQRSGPTATLTGVDPWASVVIPALNEAETIGTQLDALAGQDVDAPWEVIVVDNGSTDDTITV